MGLFLQQVPRDGVHHLVDAPPCLTVLELSGIEVTSPEPLEWDNA